MQSPIHLLVVANETLDCRELSAALERRAREHAVRVYLLAPAAAKDRAIAHARLDRLVRRLADVGVEAVGLIGHSDPLVAVEAVWNPAFYDEVIVCTLPAPVSRWLRVDLPARITRLTGALVHHIEAPGTARPAIGKCGRVRA